MARRLRVVVADDEPAMRRTLLAYLAESDHIEVAAVASDGEEALAQVVETHPDVVLMDLVMPRLDGVAATRRIREMAIETRVLVVSNHIDEDTVHLSLAAGADGYFVKLDDLTGLCRAVDTVASGDHYFSHRVAQHLLPTEGGPAPSRRTTPASSVPRSPEPLLSRNARGRGAPGGRRGRGGPGRIPRRAAVEALPDSEATEAARRLRTLSPRERQVVAAASKGWSASRTASFLGLSARTVEEYRRNAGQKMGAANLKELVRLATLGGMGSDSGVAK